MEAVLAVGLGFSGNLRVFDVFVVFSVWVKTFSKKLVEMVDHPSHFGLACIGTEDLNVRLLVS